MRENSVPDHVEIAQLVPSGRYNKNSREEYTVAQILTLTPTMGYLITREGELKPISDDVNAVDLRQEVHAGQVRGYMLVAPDWRYEARGGSSTDTFSMMPGRFATRTDFGGLIYEARYVFPEQNSVGCLRRLIRFGR